MQVTDVQRFTLHPGDRLIARVNRDWLDQQEARIVRERIREQLELPVNVPILVVTRDWDFTVVDHTW